MYARKGSGEHRTTPGKKSAILLESNKRAGSAHQVEWMDAREAGPFNHRSAVDTSRFPYRERSSGSQSSLQGSYVDLYTLTMFDVS